MEEAIIIQKEQARNKQEIYKDVSQEKKEEPKLEVSKLFCSGPVKFW